MKNAGNGAEIRCGFSVSEKRKKIWKVQLELLKELDRVCDKHGLRYYAVNGTLLGAVRHHGFIPWDDDMDVMMPRPDYEAFKRIAGSEFSGSLYFQDGVSQPGYYRMYGRLRNADTTAVAWMDVGGSKKNGIFIDIFPIDGISREPKKRHRQQKLLKLMDDLAIVSVYKDAPAPPIKKMLGRALMRIIGIFLPFDSFIARMEKLRRSMSFEESDLVYIFTHSKALIMKKRGLLKPLRISFEDVMIPVPADYRSVLRRKYGDYMELPPEEKRGKHHSIFFDPENPYDKYYGKIDREFFEKEVNNF